VQWNGRLDGIACSGIKDLMDCLQWSKRLEQQNICSGMEDWLQLLAVEQKALALRWNRIHVCGGIKDLMDCLQWNKRLEQQNICSRMEDWLQLLACGGTKGNCIAVE
jgi:hypothetical protein